MDILKIKKMQLAFIYHFSRGQNTSVDVYFFRTKLQLKLKKIICVRLFTIFIVSMINRNLFMDGYCRNMYDDLTSYENTNQYEDILKKGCANWY